VISSAVMAPEHKYPDRIIRLMSLHHSADLGAVVVVSSVQAE